MTTETLKICHDLVETKAPYEVTVIDGNYFIDDDTLARVAEDFDWSLKMNDDGVEYTDEVDEVVVTTAAKRDGLWPLPMDYTWMVCEPVACAEHHRRILSTVAVYLEFTDGQWVIDADTFEAKLDITADPYSNSSGADVDSVPSPDLSLRDLYNLIPASGF